MKYRDKVHVLRIDNWPLVPSDDAVKWIPSKILAGVELSKAAENTFTWIGSRWAHVTHIMRTKNISLSSVLCSHAACAALTVEHARVSELVKSNHTWDVPSMTTSGALNSIANTLFGKIPRRARCVIEAYCGCEYNAELRRCGTLPSHTTPFEPVKIIHTLRMKRKRSRLCGDRLLQLRVTLCDALYFASEYDTTKYNTKASEFYLREWDVVFFSLFPLACWCWAMSYPHCTFKMKRHGAHYVLFVETGETSARLRGYLSKRFRNDMNERFIPSDILNADPERQLVFLSAIYRATHGVSCVQRSAVVAQGIYYMLHCNGIGSSIKNIGLGNFTLSIRHGFDTSSACYSAHGQRLCHVGKGTYMYAFATRNVGAPAGTCAGIGCALFQERRLRPTPELTESSSVYEKR